MREGLRNKEFSSRELTAHYLERIEKLDSQFNSFITVSTERALAEADNADQRIARGENSALLGIPVAQKDIFCTKGVRSSCGSKMLDNFVPPYDATVIEKMSQSGAVML
ncbi:MAG: Asp-tRNA(Asn)/Glu-tRNA(Gln) amidotransferase GatCAB subunit A, partial [Pseudomonadales bacterium]|nr:Asp-tRNA(Asn)/Glu-tRNA(Gln) amidotransferase GatCAB subunit A [Pseudomonadales bacterium]